MMKSVFLRRRVVYLILAVVLVSGFYLVFRPSKTIRPLSERIATFNETDPRWEVETSAKKKYELNRILSQSFHFLGQGKQISAYESQDGQYVLKFLWQAPLGGDKLGYLQHPDLSSLIERLQETKETYGHRKDTLYGSFLVAYKYVPEQTGTVFVHLNATEGMYKKVQVLDNKENPDLIDSDTTQWVIQKRARLVKPVIIELMWENKVEEAKQRIDQLFSLLFECAKRGIIDGDDDLIRNNNIGFLPTRAIYVDVGQLRRAEGTIGKDQFADDVERLHPLYHWLQVNYPELASHYKIRKDEIINLYCQELES